jgi:hypothetical protein
MIVATKSQSDNPRPSSVATDIETGGITFAALAARSFICYPDWSVLFGRRYAAFSCNDERGTAFAAS